ncbi:tetratricopeptide repeat protein [Paracraurococcus lichenis]|uniref:Tetratricopeptide repeat protein n=1 Tax=Paracraurococcus lichenis TaxID=3064888 RepID=A0ABT9E7N2_9PROT|nr:hypothetical protein [Paracraurococcus sp. LOR1-02]MDO9712156.1 hypothetical protein [Paracraurococcus sp. LOR1-02]
MEGLAKRATNLVTLSAALLGLCLAATLFAMLGARAAKELQGRVLEVQPIAVQGEKASVLDPQRLAARVAAEINRVLAAGNELGSLTAAAGIQDLPEVSIPETGLSLRLVGQVLDAVLKDPARSVSGELQAGAEGITLTLWQPLGARVASGRGTGRADPAGLDRAITAAVAQLLRETQPVIYAAHAYAACREVRGVKEECLDPQPDTEGKRRPVLALLQAAARGTAGLPAEPAALAQAAYLQGIWFHEHHDRAAAIEHYGRAIALSPGDAATAHYHRGNAWQELGDARQAERDAGAAGAARDYYRQAEWDFRRSLARRPDNAFAWNGLGNAIAKLDPADEEAAEAYRRASRLMPLYLAPQVGLGRLCLLRRDRRGATEAFERAALLAGQEPALVLDLAAALRPLDADAARRLLARAAIAHPGGPEAQTLAAALEGWPPAAAPARGRAPQATMLAAQAAQPGR